MSLEQRSILYGQLYHPDTILPSLPYRDLIHEQMLSLYKQSNVHLCGCAFWIRGCDLLLSLPYSDSAADKGGETVKRAKCHWDWNCIWSQSQHLVVSAVLRLKKNKFKPKDLGTVPIAGGKACVFSLISLRHCATFYANYTAFACSCECFLCVHLVWISSIV